MSSNELFTTIISSDEINLKSQSIKKQFMILLAGNVKAAMKSWNISVKIRNEWDLLFIDSKSHEEATEITRIASKVFGVYSTSPAIRIPLDTTRKIITNLEMFVKRFVFPGDSFIIKLKISNNKDFNRNEFLNAAIKRIEERIPGSKATTYNPLREINVTIRGQNDIYLSAYKLAGPGGFPLGSNGKAIFLISSGIDSPVASWLMMKRGVSPVFLHFDISPFNSTERNSSITEDLVKILVDNWCYGRREIKFYTIPFGSVLTSIRNKSSSKHICVLCKRLMLNIAERIAIQENAQALVTGDSLGQVASQTAWNLKVVTDICNLPVYRPLIGFDKREIVDIGRKIGTFSDKKVILSGHCQALSDNPAIRAEVESIFTEEKQLNVKALVKQAIDLGKMKKLTPP